MTAIPEWFAAHPVAAGAATLLLMWGDWLLTLRQQREQERPGADHTRTYPVDTIEGNPLLRPAVQRKRAVEPRHFVPALLISAMVAAGLHFLPAAWRVPVLGYVWGLFLIVSTTHLGNLLGYRASRRGVHGRLWLHQRAAHLVQAGRYAALAALLVVLAILTASPFLAGVAVAGGSTVLRQFAWIRRLPAIAGNDPPPAG